MILVDPRVGKKGGQSSAERLTKIVSTLRSRVNCPVRGAKPRLDSGDFAFEGSGPDGEILIGVEWKTVADALSSMRSDRLAADQLSGMSKDYGVSFLIVQGYWKPGEKGVLLTRYGKDWTPLNLAPKSSKFRKTFQYSELFKFMVSAGVLKNVVVLRSCNEDETLWMIAHLYSWWQKPWDEHRSMDPIKLQSEVTFTKMSEVRGFAADLPGIGWTRSLAVEKAFGSIHRASNASVDMWEAVEGVGPKTALNVWKHIRRKAL